MRRWARFGWIACLSIACGGAGKQAEDPTDVESEPSESMPAGDSDADAASDDNVRKRAGTPEAKGGPGLVSAQSADDTTAVLELVVNDPELDPYLKLGEPGRFPLKIAGAKLPANLELVKNNEPVQVVPAPKDKSDPVLVFTELDVQKDKASVRYRYDVEGIRGSATLTKGQYGWELKNSRIVEHQ